MRSDLADFAHLDLHREARQGIPEVVLAADKTVAQTLEITRELYAKLGRGLVTRVREDQFAALSREFPAGRAARDARVFCLGRMPARPGRVAVVCGGTSDLAVAREAQETLIFLGFEPSLIPDVGVAGLHRLQTKFAEIEPADAVICAAGMEASLPTVLAGLLSCPVIAVPVATDVERGWQGVPALLSMLHSCVPGVVVVNVDNGFGAACAVARMMRP